jgi:spore coat protein U-like protein
MPGARSTCLAAPGIFTAAALFAAAAHGASCTVANSTLAFGSYNPVSGSATTSNATITVTCGATISASTTVPFMLLLSAGASGSVTARQMTGGTNNMPYNIYTSGSYSTVWDNTTGVSGSCPITGLLGIPVLTYGSISVTAYGRIPAAQPVSSGSYTDALTITVSF